MAEAICSWPCVRFDSSSSSNLAPVASARQQQDSRSIQQQQQHVNNNIPPPIQQGPVQGGQSYLDKVRGSQPESIDVDSLPSPVMNGGVPTITLPRAVVERGKQYCQYSLIGRLDFSKISILRLTAIIGKELMPQKDWKVILLGKGFFMLRLDCRDDLVRIWAKAWNFGGQVVRFTQWTPDFDPESQKVTNALVWVKFPGLKQQYWDYEILMRIGKGLGKPIGVDQKTISREFGFYALVLIDIDMSQPIPWTVNVKEEGGREFVQAVEIDKLPEFCSHCKVVGHGVLGCRGLQRVFQVPNKEKEPAATTLEKNNDQGWQTVRYKGNQNEGQANRNNKQNQQYRPVQNRGQNQNQQGNQGQGVMLNQGQTSDKTKGNGSVPVMNLEMEIADPNEEFHDANENPIINNAIAEEVTMNQLKEIPIENQDVSLEKIGVVEDDLNDTESSMPLEKSSDVPPTTTNGDVIQPSLPLTTPNLGVGIQPPIPSNVPTTDSIPLEEGEIVDNGEMMLPYTESEEDYEPVPNGCIENSELRRSIREKRPTEKGGEWTTVESKKKKKGITAPGQEQAIKEANHVLGILRSRKKGNLETG